MGGREVSRPYRVLFQSPSIFPLNPFRYRWHRCIDICRGDGGKKKGHAFGGMSFRLRCMNCLGMRGIR